MKQQNFTLLVQTQQKNNTIESCQLSLPYTFVWVMLGAFMRIIWYVF